MPAQANLIIKRQNHLVSTCTFYFVIIHNYISYCSSQKCRYFSFADQSSPSLSLGEPPSSDAASGDGKSLKSGGTSSVTEVLRSYSSARARGEGSEALTKILKEALQHHKTSEVCTYNGRQLALKEQSLVQFTTGISKGKKIMVS